MNLATVLERRADEQGWRDQPAYLVGRRVITHGQVHEGSARAAGVLAGHGVRRGHRVLLALDDGPELVWAFLGTLRLGAVAVPVNPRLTEDDHRAMATDAQPALVVCEADLAGRFSGPTPVLAAPALVAGLADARRHAGVPVGAAAPAYAQYTSGTTGAPKAALHRHGDATVYFEAFARQAIALGPDDVSLSVSKLYFAYGLGNSLFFPLLAGCRAVLHPGPPDADAIADLVGRRGVTVLYSVPTFYARLVAGGRPEAFRSLRVAVSAGEPLVVALAERARRLLACPILDGIGSTEVGQTFASNTLDSWRDGTVGRALAPYEVAVRDDEGHDVPTGDIGSLEVRGPTLLIEYLNKPEATATARRGDWLRTGDRASLDAEGFLHLHGRNDDIELVGGINVAPQEIEELLSTHPRVTEVAVAAVRDADGASCLQAFVVPAADAGPHDALAGELRTLARSCLAPYKAPRTVNFVSALPRTPTGKLRRFALRSGAWR
ncbi:MAG TPA: AMP-binding protein [Acidimicrobiales bacterium]|nr:AMP-binding protein [Acidimicrobiales bacterium]